MLTIIKKPISIILIIIIAALGVGGYFYFNRSKIPAYEYTTVKKGGLAQEVSVTGRVKATENVELAFEKSGKIIQASAKVNDRVKAGQILAVIENSDIRAQIAQAQAGVDSAKAVLNQYQAALQSNQAKLEEYKKGARTEEIQVAQTTLDNAQKALSDAQTNLVNVKSKADADLLQVYDGSLTAANDSISTALYSLSVLTDIQYTYFQSYFDTDSAKVAEAKEAAIFILLGTNGAGRATNSAINQLNGGAKLSVQTAQSNPSFANIDTAINQVKSALFAVRAALDAVPTNNLSSTYKTNLNTEKNNINTEISTISGKIESIAVQKATNKNNIATAQASLTTAQNTLASAQANLTLKKAGYIPEQIAAQEAQVKQAESTLASQSALIKQAQANAQNIQSQLAKTIIQTPVDGIVILQDAKVGEITAPNKIIISIIADAKFEIETDIPEADIAKVRINDLAKVTLDAYGADTVFETKVITIDPAETMVEGVATYKTKLQFVNEDERIKSGMTANIDILTDKRENALIIPQRAVITKNSEKFVLKDTGKPEPAEVKIETGLKGSDGMIEVLSGLKENDRIVSSGGETTD